MHGRLDILLVSRVVRKYSINIHSKHFILRIMEEILMDMWKKLCFQIYQNQILTEREGITEN